MKNNLLIIGQVIMIAVGMGLILKAFTTPGVNFLMTFGGGMLVGSGLMNLYFDLKYRSRRSR